MGSFSAFSLSNVGQGDSCLGKARHDLGTFLSFLSIVPGVTVEHVKKSQDDGHNNIRQ